MKKLILFFCMFVTFTLNAQQEITLEDVAKHVGESVTVRGKIFGARYLEETKNSPTFINIGGAYPNQLLTIVIWGDVRKKLGYKPEEKPYSAGMAKVIGKVVLYKGKPQIVLYDAKQLIILYDEDVPTSQVPKIKKR